MPGRVLLVATVLACIWRTDAAAQMPIPYSSAIETETETPSLMLPEEMTNPTLQGEGLSINPSLDSGALSANPPADSGELAPGELGDPTYVNPGESWQAPYSVEGGETLDPESN
jgi:hypothetical protein